MNRTVAGLVILCAVVAILGGIAIVNHAGLSSSATDREERDLGRVQTLMGSQSHKSGHSEGSGDALASDPEEIDHDGIPACEPDTWSGESEYRLPVRWSKMKLVGGKQDGGPHKVEIAAYNGRQVGPTIRVRRGQAFTIELINDLPPAREPTAKYFKQEDEPHDLYTTNLHVHGLHVSPSGDSDNVFAEVPPGSSRRYTYTIPADHPAGTFWYHPHKHGSVAYQLANGMAGAIIVEGDRSPDSRDLEGVPEIAAAREHVFVMQQMIFDRGQLDVGRVDPNDVYTEPPNPNSYQVTAINGVVQPTYTMHPGEVQRWRFIHAGQSEPIALCWYDENNKPVRIIPFHEIALDGIPTGEMTAKRRVWLYPGNRSDVLVQAPERKGNYFLCTFQEDETAPPGQAKTVLKRLARLVVGGSPKPMGLPKESRLAICKPYVSIETSECTAKRNLVLEFDYEKRVFHIAGESFSKQSRTDTAQLGSTEEWTLTSTAPEGDQPDEPHPFHMHVNPFQVIQIEDLETGQVKKIDEWRDTMVVEKGKKITIRIRFRDFAGKTVYHCHAVDHEDQGMMRVLRIVDPKAPEQPTDGELTECKTPLPQSKLGASLEQSRMTVVVFFRGMGCAHCRQELRRLLAEAATIASDATIVAVSSEPISDVDRVIKSLEVPSGVQFRLVVDQDRQFFRDFGCYEQGPQHGLFIIDKENLLRAQFVGEVPFAKPAEVVEVVRKLSR